MPRTAQQVIDRRLAAHLVQWLGSWPPGTTLDVVAAIQRDTPGWDGQVHPAIGVADPRGMAVLSVPPAAAGAVQGHAEHRGPAAALSQLPELLGLPGRGTYRATFRWSTDPAPMPEVGRWVPADSAEAPVWLRPFGGQVLVATGPDGTHLAGVGIKRHDGYGHELSVVTAPAARARGLARSLIAQAARRVLDDGAVPTYLHDPSNVASARVAQAAGFPDHGWTSFGISEAASPEPSVEDTVQGGSMTKYQELVVYGTGWCPDVRRSRALLDRREVPYRYVDLEADAAATRAVRTLQRGSRRIPTLVWPDGEHLVEPTDEELSARLDAQE